MGTTAVYETQQGQTRIATDRKSGPKVPFRDRRSRHIVKDFSSRSSPTDRAGEFFKLSRYGKFSSFELRNWEVSNLRFFVDDVIIRVGLGFLAQVIAPWAPTPRGNFLFRFLQKTTRKSAFLEPMVGILALVVCKLCPKSNKLYN